LKQPQKRAAVVRVARIQRRCGRIRCVEKTSGCEGRNDLKEKTRKILFPTFGFFCLSSRF
jgi:hypothetical protein